MLATSLVYATPIPEGERVGELVDSGGEQVTLKGPAEVTLPGIKLGDVTASHIECGGRTNDKPKLGECLDALLQIPPDPDVITFNTRGEPRPTIPFSAKSGRCEIKVDQVNAGGDRTSWNFAAIVATNLINTCQNSFSLDSRLSGKAVFGLNANLKVELLKFTPRLGEPGYGEPDDVVAEPGLETS